MPEKAILAIEEALLASLFTQRALVDLLIKKGILKREDLQNAILKTETKNIGVGNAGKKLYLEKRSSGERRQIARRIKKDKRSYTERRKAI